MKCGLMALVMKETLNNNQINGVTETVTPQFIRLPRSGERCPYTGLSRSSLNELILPCPANDYRPPVRSVVQKKRHATRGCRLILLSSLLDFLHGLEEPAPGRSDSGC